MCRLLDWRTAQYRLINWTTAGSSTALSARIVSNISWPISTAPGAQGLIADFETGVAVGTVAGIFGSASGGAPTTGGDFGLAAGAFGTRIVGISLITGQVLYNFTTEDTSFNPGSNSVYDGKVFIPMDMGFLNCYDLVTGKLLWSSTEFDYPWGAFGGYNAEAAYGLYYWQTYDGVVAFNTTTGQRAWKYQAPSTPFETPYTMPNGTSEYSFFGVSMGSRRKNLCLQLRAHGKSTNYPRLETSLHRRLHRQRNMEHNRLHAARCNSRRLFNRRKQLRRIHVRIWQRKKRHNRHCPRRCRTERKRSCHKRHSLGPITRSTRHTMRLKRLNDALRWNTCTCSIQSTDTTTTSP